MANQSQLQSYFGCATNSSMLGCAPSEPLPSLRGHYRSFDSAVFVRFTVSAYQRLDEDGSILPNIVRELEQSINELKTEISISSAK